MTQRNRAGSTKILFGLGWTSLSTIVNGLSQILKLSILARFLQKEDFGIVAILTLVLGLTQVFSDMGFSAAIMSEKKLSKQKFISLYWLQFIVFNGFAIIIALLSPLIATYYHEPSLIILLPLMLTELFFVSIGKLYDTVLQKAMNFKIIAVRNLATATISLCLAVVLAILGCGVYSLVVSTLFQAMLVNIWNLAAGQKEYKLSLGRINFTEIADLLKVGFYQMGTQVIDYLAGKLDIFIISSFIGIEAVGIYNLAKELVFKFVIVVNTIVARVMLPVLSERQGDIEDLKRTFLGFVRRLSLLNAPIVGFVFLFSSTIVTVFYGAGYEEVVEIVKIMAIWSVFVVLSSPNGLVAIVIKRTDITFVYTIFRFFIIGILLYVFARDSVRNAAVTLLLAYMVMFFVNWYMLLWRVLKIGLLKYMSVFYKSWLGVISNTVLVVLMSAYVLKGGGFMESIVLCLIYALGIMAYLFVFEQQMLNSTRIILKNAICQKVIAYENKR